MARVRLGCAASLLVLAAALGGCGGSTGKQHLFDARDAIRIAAVPPVAPGWIWPTRPSESSSAGPSAGSTQPSASGDALLEALRRRMAKLVDRGSASESWQDSEKLGNFDVGVFGSAADAHAAMAALNAFSRGWGARSGTVTKTERLHGLGDEGWRLWVSGNGDQVTYHWRRRNLVLEAHTHCFGNCPADLDAATFHWVEAIDKEANPWPAGATPAYDDPVARSACAPSTRERKPTCASVRE
jgi:hypothetical protein